MKKTATWIPEQCPRCGMDTREDQGPRGVAPVYRIEKGYRCCNPFCDIAGYLIYQDHTPERIEYLAEIKRRSIHYRELREVVAKGIHPFFGNPDYDKYIAWLKKG